MANEHVLRHETNVAIPFTVANATGIEKGALLAMNSPMTAIAVSATRSTVGGVAKGEKIASDGRTKLEVYRGGIFSGVASGNIGKGEPLVSDHTGNKLVSASALSVVTGISGHIVFGVALDTVTDGQTFYWELRPQNYE